jgi:hypothetical protein
MRDPVSVKIKYYQIELCHPTVNDPNHEVWVRQSIKQPRKQCALFAILTRYMFRDTTSQ